MGDAQWRQAVLELVKKKMTRNDIQIEKEQYLKKWAKGSQYI